MKKPILKFTLEKLDNPPGLRFQVLEQDETLRAGNYAGPLRHHK